MDKIILDILKKLEKNGYESYIVGGYVRNKILGIESSDIDICTNALPKDTIKIFKLNKDTKENYGSVNIKTKKYNIDITTFRSEGKYNNHRPENITYVKDIKTDLKRRDFTINSIIINSKEEYIDYYNGIKDLENKIIKCIGSTKEKLTEDPLRMLRAIRLKTLYNLNLDEEIINFIKANKELIYKVSYYRKKEELDKIFSSENKIKGLKTIKELGLLKVLEIEYNDIKYTKDIHGIYAQIEFKGDYPFTKETKKIIKNIKEILKEKEVNNFTLYKYGLYINGIAGEILGYDYEKINKMFNALPIKEKKDIKISYKSIVKINNNCYNNINDIYASIEENILSGKLKNKSRDIIRFIRK